MYLSQQNQKNEKWKSGKVTRRFVDFSNNCHIYWAERKETKLVAAASIINTKKNTEIQHAIK